MASQALKKDFAEFIWIILPLEKRSPAVAG